MRLYCPSCRAMYEEPEERFHQQGGRLPCRVCRTELVPHNLPADFAADGKTTVSPPPSEMSSPPRKMSPPPGAVVGGAVGGGGSGVTTSQEIPRPQSFGSGPVSGPQKTQPLDMDAMMRDGGAETEMISTPGRPSAPSPSYDSLPPAPRPSAPSPYQSAPSPFAAQPPPRQPSGPPPSAAPKSFHDNPTFIFETPRASNPPPQMSRPGPTPSPPQSAPHAPPSGPVSAQGSGAAKKRRQVVIGGAAGVGSASESLTQAFDVKVIPDEMLQAKKAAQTGPIPQPPGMGPGPGGPPPQSQHQHVVVGQPGLVHGGPQPVHVPGPPAAAAQGKGSPVLLVIVLVALVLITVAVLALVGVLPNPFAGSKGGHAATAEAARAAVPPRADRLLRDLAERLDPPVAASGNSANQPGFALAIVPDSGGTPTFWVAGSQGERQVQPGDGPADVIQADRADVFILADRQIGPVMVIGTADALAAQGLVPHLAARSPMGSDAYYTYAVDAPDGASPRLQLGNSAVVVHHTGWPAPRVICYSGLLPAEQLFAVVEDASGGAEESQATVEVGPDVDLVTTVSLLQAINRPGLHFHLTLASAPVEPQECAR